MIEGRSAVDESSDGHSRTPLDTKDRSLHVKVGEEEIRLILLYQSRQLSHEEDRKGSFEEEEPRVVCGRIWVVLESLSAESTRERDLLRYTEGSVYTGQNFRGKSWVVTSTDSLPLGARTLTGPLRHYRSLLCVGQTKVSRPTRCT